MPSIWRGCCQEAPGSIYSCSGLAEESGAYNVSLVQRWVNTLVIGTINFSSWNHTFQQQLTIFSPSCYTDNCNSEPTAFGPEPKTTTKKTIVTPKIEVDPVPASKTRTEEKTKQEEELAGRLAESRPAELDIGRNRAVYFSPSIVLVFLSMIVWTTELEQNNALAVDLRPSILHKCYWAS